MTTSYTTIAQAERSPDPAGERPLQADLFIAKPFDVDHVLASVYALLADAPAG